MPETSSNRPLLPRNSPKRSRPRRRNDKRALPGLVDPRSSPALQPNAQDLTEIVKQGYMPLTGNTATDSFGVGASRICGAWVGVLSGLLRGSHNHGVLWIATKALAETITCPVEASSHSYHDAISMVRKSLAVNDHSFELIPSIMCLALIEVLSPNFCGLCHPVRQLMRPVDVCRLLCCPRGPYRSSWGIF